MPSRRSASGLVAMVAAGALVVSGCTSAPTSSSAATKQGSRRDLALRLLNSPVARYLTAPALRGLATLGGVTPEEAGKRGLSERGPTPARAGAALGPQSAEREHRDDASRSVRVNNPRADTSQVDQTTQSETTVAVSGANVVIGFNDSQQALASTATAGADLTGYAYSRDGGESFTDAGALPNAPGAVNLGDPWLATDRTGAFYYSTLMLAPSELRGGVLVGVAKSTDGGRSFGAPVKVSPEPSGFDFYQGDKPAVTTGRARAVATRDNLYVAWDDFAADPVKGIVQAGLAVARSIDGGRTFQLSYADRLPLDETSCSVAIYTGAQPLVDPANGILRVFAERLDLDFCRGRNRFSQWVFTSSNGGGTFGPGKRIAGVTPVSTEGALALEPGKSIRTIEFPTVGQRGNTLYVAWNDAGRGTSDVRLARSTNGGSTWSTSWLTEGADEDLQPALATDAAGVHVAFYRLSGGRFTVDVADSTDGQTFAVGAVSDTSFPGVFNDPPFDPTGSPAYMGDYLAVATDGTHRYFAWGDNRSWVTTPLWPQGRNDPDVYAARR